MFRFESKEPVINQSDFLGVNPRITKIMRKIMVILIGLMTLAAIIVGGYYLWDWHTRVSTSELELIVQRDGKPFDAKAFPDEMLDHLASHRVVLIGETHFLSEHTDLTFELLRQLHARGFRQFLFEWTQAADWALEDFVNDGEMTADWTVPSFLGDPIIAIREFNRTLPEKERIRVHAIDIHLEDYGGTQSWLSYVKYIAKSILRDQGPLAEFLDGEHDTYESHEFQLERLQAQLADGRAELITSWGDYWYDIVFEMIEVELMGVAARSIKQSDYKEHARLREEAIRWMADRRIQSTPHGTLINVGSTHAQKERLWGTDHIEWLGDYLAHKSPATEGSVFALWVPAANIISSPDSDVPDFDLKASPENEILRVINQIWPDQMVYLPLDDPIFSDGRVPINSSGEIFVGAPKRHYDAYLLLPIAHREYLGD